MTAGNYYNCHTYGVHTDTKIGTSSGRSEGVTVVMWYGYLSAFGKSDKQVSGRIFINIKVLIFLLSFCFGLAPGYRKSPGSILHWLVGASYEATQVHLPRIFIAVTS